MSVKVRWKNPVGRRTITKCRFPGKDACKETETTFNLGLRQLQPRLSNALKRKEIIQSFVFFFDCPDSLFLFSKQEGDTARSLEIQDITARGLSSPTALWDRQEFSHAPWRATFINLNNIYCVQHYNLGSKITTWQGTEAWNIKGNDRHIGEAKFIAKLANHPLTAPGRLFLSLVITRQHLICGKNLEFPVYAAGAFYKHMVGRCVFK